MKMLTVSLLVCVMMALTGAAACPHGWTQYSGRCFIYVPTPMRWANAELSCQYRGGNLASVHSFQEHQVIQVIIQRMTHRYPETWLGGYDAVQEGTWLWSDGTPFNFKYWGTGQPSNYRRSQHCLVMNYGDDKRNDDQQCHYTKPFVCAKKP